MQMLKNVWRFAAAVALGVGPAQAQSHQTAVDLAGVWEVDTPDGRQQVIVRADSSASFNEEIVRWRIHEGLLYIAFGDEWVGYDFERKKNELTLSGGDLEEPITLDWVGPPTPLPAGVSVPPAPPFHPATE